MEAEQESAMQLAKTVQEALLTPNPFPKNMNIFTFYEAAHSTGGDWYGIFPSKTHARCYVFVGDVTGHGLSAALVTAIASGVISTGIELIEPIEDDPIKILGLLAKQLNDKILSTEISKKHSMTMAMILIDFEKQNLVYSNAGHLPIYLIRENNLKTLFKSGSMLGMSEQSTFQNTCIDLKKGDILCIYTDGLIENLEQLGEKKVDKKLRGILTSDLELKQLEAKIIADLISPTKNLKDKDDTTFVLIEFTKFELRRTHSEEAKLALG